MDAAHAHRHRGGRKHQLIAGRHLACENSTGDYRALSCECKYAIYGEAKQSVVAARSPVHCSITQISVQLRDTGIIGFGCVGCKERRVRERRRRKPRADFAAHLRKPRCIDAIGLGERHRALRHAEQLQNGQMFARLRHHTVVGGDHQQRKVDAARAGRHRVHEFFVPRYIDQAKHIAVVEWRIGVAEFDRNATRLLFLEPVGIHASQRAHQGSLAMIDMAGRADDHGRLSQPASAFISNAGRRGSASNLSFDTSVTPLVSCRSELRPGYRPWFAVWHARVVPRRALTSIPSMIVPAYASDGTSGHRNGLELLR